MIFALVLFPLALVPSMAMTIGCWLLGIQLLGPEFLPCLGINNPRAQPLRQGGGQFLEEVWERFLHTARIFYFNPRHFQRQSSKTHRHSVVIVSLDRGAMELSRINRQAVAL